MNRIYFDYAATTPLDPRVRAAMEPYQKNLTGNPNSIHHEGQGARAAIDKSRQVVADIFKRAEEQIIFTPSATSANNLALQGIVKRFKKLYPHLIPEIIISPLEHASIYETARVLEREGEIILTLLTVNTNGQISLEELQEKISQRTALVSIQWVNNETGIIQPVEKIFEIMQTYRARHQTAYPFFHTDAVQGIGHLNIEKILNVDYITLSAHKIYGPTGIGVLIIPKEPLLEPIIYGGGQENNWWSGTESTDRIVGCGVAIKNALSEQQKESQHLKVLREYFIKQVSKHAPHIIVRGEDNIQSPHIVSLHIPESIRPDVALDLAGIACSSGAACSQQSVAPSRVLQALGASIQEAQESVRVSFGKQTTKEEIDILVNTFVAMEEHSKK
jgi:cysteine desulfurase